MEFTTDTAIAVVAVAIAISAELRARRIERRTSVAWTPSAQIVHGKVRFSVTYAGAKPLSGARIDTSALERVRLHSSLGAHQLKLRPGESLWLAADVGDAGDLPEVLEVTWDSRLRGRVRRATVELRVWRDLLESLERKPHP